MPHHSSAAKALILLPLLAFCQNASASNPDWRAAAQDAMPQELMLGRVLQLDAANGKAIVAAFPSGGDFQASPGNIFEPGKIVEVKLKTADGALVFESLTVRDKDAADKTEDAVETDQLMAELTAQWESEPDVMPCRIAGFAMSESREGTAVREAPSERAKIVGWLAPDFITRTDDVDPFGGLMPVEFQITGYKDGWFRIENATPPGAPYNVPLPPDYPPTYSGKGWIPVTAASGAYAWTGMPVPRLLSYPNVNAHAYAPGPPVADAKGNLSLDGAPLARLHACSGLWGLTTSHDWRTGWWRGICSNQVTTCK